MAGDADASRGLTRSSMSLDCYVLQVWSALCYAGPGDRGQLLLQSYDWRLASSAAGTLELTLVDAMGQTTTFLEYASGEFFEFLSVLGQRIKLSEHTGFRGGLDVKGAMHVRRCECGQRARVLTVCRQFARYRLQHNGRGLGLHRVSRVRDHVPCGADAAMDRERRTTDSEEATHWQ